MKKIITSLALAAVSIPAFCQITLDQSTYPLPTDSVAVIDVSGQGASMPLSGSNQIWNYTAITPGSGTLYYNVYETVSSDPDFPAAQFVVRNNIKGLTPAVGYSYDQYYAITSTGAQVIGIHVPAQAYGLGAYTGNNADTLYVLDNVIYYPTTPRTLVAFPATNNSVWRGNLRHVVNMELTVASASLNRTPMQQAFYVNRTDTVIGWGTLQLPSVSGFNSNVPVLQDRVSQYCLDSLYVGGAPAPPTLTGAFGITQGQISGPKYYRDIFYRTGSFNYQMLFNYTDNTFATLYSSGGVYLNTALPVATGISEVHTGGMLSSIYPNPVQGDHFTIALSSPTKAADIRIQDVTGRIVGNISSAISGDIMTVQTGNTMSDGVYIYTILDAAGAAIATGKFSVSK